MQQLLLLMAVLQFFGGTARSADDAGLTVLNPDDERIMYVKFKEGYQVHDSLLVYPVEDKWFLPLGQLADAFGLDISFSALAGKAEGTIATEDREFRLDAKKCEVFYRGKKEKFDCNGVIGNQGELFVESNLLKDWFEMDLDIAPFSSLITVTPNAPFPALLKKQREKRGVKRRGKKRDDTHSDYLHMPIVRKPFDGVFMDNNVKFSLSGPRGNRTVSHSTRISGELLGFDFLGNIAGSNLNFSDPAFTLSREEIEPILLGPLRARKIVLFERGIPTLPMVGGSRSGLPGISVSNRTKNVSLNFGSENFEGALPPGWDVELYKNGILIDRKGSNDTGLYRFDDIDLNVGTTSFTLEFYGPQGQRRTESRDFLLNSSFLPKSTGFYDFTILPGKPNQDRLAFRYDYGLRRGLRLSTGFSRFPVVQELPSENFFYLGLNTFWAKMVLSPAVSLNTSGGRAYRFETRFPLFRFVTINGKYTYLDGFSSAAYNGGDEPESAKFVVDEADIGAQHSWRIVFPARMSWRAKQTRYFLAQTQRTLSNSFNLDLSIAQLSNFGTWTSKVGGQDSFSGTFRVKPLRKYVRSVDTSLGFSYSLSRITSGSLDVSRRFGSRDSGRISFSRSFVSNDNTLQTSLQKRFEKFATSMGFSIGSSWKYEMTLGLTFSLDRDSVTSRWEVYERSQVKSGAVSVFAFRDKNANGIFDPGESPVADVPISVQSSYKSRRTDSTGYVFIPSLSSYRPTHLSLASLDTSNMFLRSVVPGFVFYPRPGTTTQVLLPLIIVGNIDGALTVSGGGQDGAAFVHLELLDSEDKVVKSTRADEFGIYSFMDVPVGTYTVRIAEKSLKLAGLRSDPPLRSVTIPEEGDIVGDQDFALHARSD